MPSNSAEYMRAYRARKRVEDRPLDRLSDASARRMIAELESENSMLREEVRRLKRDLAARPHAFNSRPFTPVPKGKRL